MTSEQVRATLRQTIGKTTSANKGQFSYHMHKSITAIAVLHKSDVSILMMCHQECIIIIRIVIIIIIGRPEHGRYKQLLTLINALY